MPAFRRFVTSLLVLLSVAAWCVSAQGQAAPGDAAPAVVLDTLSVWRIHETLKPPVIQFDDGLKPITSTYQWLDRETAAAPADWTKPEFSDATWLRGSARATSRTPYVAKACLRARFEVTDPAEIKDLKLTLVYYGGAIVYLNGQELIRGSLAKEGKPELADGYPPEAFLSEDGKMLPAASWQMDKFPKALAARARTLQDVAVSANLLRKGVNVLAIIELMQSPDTLAVEYKVPLWSDRHWAMIADSMRYIGEIGSRVVHVPLIAQTNSGNEQSMVRFIKKADGTYDYDFSIVDKYLDLAEKFMGRPKITAFTAWEIYLDTPKQEVKFSGKEDLSNHDFDREGAWRAARWDLRGKGPAVTALDPATGQLTTVNLPRFDDPRAKAIWKPLFDELHKRMAKRGLESTMVLGMASDRWPSKEEMIVLQDASGNLPWINHTHGGTHIGSKRNGMAAVAYTAYVWNVQYANALPINADPVQDPNQGRMYGWKRPQLYAEFRRFTALNDWPASTILLFSELQITGRQRGLGRVGADFWPVYKDKRGRRRDWTWDRYPQSLWHSCNLMSHVLVPGPAGPVASTRYELLRAGIQECEARIAIESVLTDAAEKAKLPADLAERSQQLLDDRVWQELKAFGDMQLTGRSYATAKDTWGYGCGGPAGHYWYAGSGWRDRAQKLYDLAGEVTRKFVSFPKKPSEGKGRDQRA